MLNYLEQSEHKVFSQNGEDGIIAAIFRAIGATNQVLVEFGCDPQVQECNSAYWLEQGWQALLMDADDRVYRNPGGRVRHEFVTAENINELFAKYGVPASFDLLSIDIDGNDYWVWKALDDSYRPRVVVIEYNSFIPADQRKAIAYDPYFVWKGTDCFGASLLALKELGERKGYTLVYCDSSATNAFFIANEAILFAFTPPPIEAVYRSKNFRLPPDPDPSHVMIDPETWAPSEPSRYRKEVVFRLTPGIVAKPQI